MIATISDTPRPVANVGLHLKREVWYVLHVLFYEKWRCFIYLSFVKVNLAWIKMRTHDDDDDMWELPLALFAGFDHLHNSYMKVVKTHRANWWEGSVCVGWMHSVCDAVVFTAAVHLCNSLNHSCWSMHNIYSLMPIDPGFLQQTIIFSSVTKQPAPLRPLHSVSEAQFNKKCG